MGDTHRAVAELKDVLAALLRVKGPKDSDTLDTRHFLAVAKADAGDIPTAVAELESVLADQVRILGPDDRDTVATREELARWRQR